MKKLAFTVLGLFLLTNSVALADTSTPTDISQCKTTPGWRSYTTPKFKSQFDCVQYVLNREIGNDIANRPNTDTWSNFMIVDTNHPAANDGAITRFSYYASNLNPFKFVVVDDTNTVQWVSDEITPAAVGLNVYTPSQRIPVMSGWNVGLYFETTGTIPFDSIGAPAVFSSNGSGVPDVGTGIVSDGISPLPRTYSFYANILVNGEHVSRASGNFSYLSGYALKFALYKNQTTGTVIGYIRNADTAGSQYLAVAQCAAFDPTENSALFGAQIIKKHGPASSGWGPWVVIKVVNPVGGPNGVTGEFTDETTAENACAAGPSSLGSTVPLDSGTLMVKQ